MVRYLTPSSPQARTIFLVALVPSRWPMTLGRRRFLAQRPLPSMMMAICDGGSRKRYPWSDGQDILFLLGNHLVHLGDELVGKGLDFVHPALELVFRMARARERLLKAFILVAADVADGHFAVFADALG